MKTTQLDGVNYTHIDTAQRLEHITKKHNAVKPSRRPARLRNTGLTNTRPGDEWIEEQAAYYAAQVRAHGFKKSLVFFTEGNKAAKFEHATLKRLVGFAGAYGCSFKIQLETMRRLAIQAGYTFDNIDPKEYKL